MSTIRLIIDNRELYHYQKGDIINHIKDDGKNTTSYEVIKQIDTNILEVKEIETELIDWHYFWKDVRVGILIVIAVSIAAYLYL